MEVMTTSPAALYIAQGCTVCGLCEAIAPRVFEVAETGCRLRPDGRWGEFIEEILLAARMCPSGVIREGNEERNDG